MDTLLEVSQALITNRMFWKTFIHLPITNIHYNAPDTKHTQEHIHPTANMHDPLALLSVCVG